MNFSYFDAIWINTDWKKSISEVNIPGLVCQLSPPMNIFLEREEEEGEMNFIFSFKLNNWLNLTINLFNSARFNRKIVLQTRKVSAGNLRLRHKKQVADSWFWHVTVPSDVSAIAALRKKFKQSINLKYFFVNCLLIWSNAACTNKISLQKIIVQNFINLFAEKGEWEKKQATRAKMKSFAFLDTAQQKHFMFRHRTRHAKFLFICVSL